MSKRKPRLGQVEEHRVSAVCESKTILTSVCVGHRDPLCNAVRLKLCARECRTLFVKLKRVKVPAWRDSADERVRERSAPRSRLYHNGPWPNLKLVHHC
jgi:hypothetical protein